MVVILNNVLNSRTQEVRQAWVKILTATLLKYVKDRLYLFPLRGKSFRPLFCVWFVWGLCLLCLRLASHS